MSDVKGDAKSRSVAIAVLSPHSKPNALAWALENFGWGESIWIKERAEVLLKWLTAGQIKSQNDLQGSAHSKTTSISVLSPSAEPKAFSWSLENFGWGLGHWVQERGEVKMRWLTFADAGEGGGLVGFAGNVWITASNATSEEYEPYDVNDYLKLVPWQHRRPRFLALLRSILAGMVDEMNFTYNLGRRFDLDSAIGVQLNQIGEWAGLLRSTLEAFNTTGIRIPDNVYRNLIKAKIASNHWDGTIPGAYSAWNDVFRGQSLLAIEDHQDMTMTMYVTGMDGSGIFREVIRQGLISFKPGGVRVRYLFTDPVGAKFFAWDAENDMYGGWAQSNWATVA